MHLFKRLSKVLLLFCVVAISFASCARAQNQIQARSQTTANGIYVATDPLAKVRYDNRYDLSLGMAYVRFTPGPNTVVGANIGGLDLAGSYWLTKHWAVEGTGRYYLGTAGAPVNTHHIDGPFVSESVLAAGPEWLGPHNKHGALIAHVLVGTAHGNFEQDLRGVPASNLGFYTNGFAPAAEVGGHIDLNRSPRLVFRISPDVLYTRFKTVSSPDPITYPNTVPIGSFNNWHFGISVGMEYKFKKKR